MCFPSPDKPVGLSTSIIYGHFTTMLSPSLHRSRYLNLAKPKFVFAPCSLKPSPALVSSNLGLGQIQPWFCQVLVKVSPCQGLAKSSPRQGLAKSSPCQINPGQGLIKFSPGHVKSWSRPSLFSVHTRASSSYLFLLKTNSPKFCVGSKCS